MSTTTTNPTARDEDEALLLHAEITEALQTEIGLKEAIANQFAGLIVAKLRRRLGAQRIYIPAPSKDERNAAIFAEYTGGNAAEVCERHGISRTRMHEILEEQRRQAEAKRNGSPVSCLKTGRTRG